MIQHKMKNRMFYFDIILRTYEVVTLEHGKINARLQRNAEA